MGGQLGNVGTGMYLPANGMRALRALGLEQAVAARGAQIGTVASDEPAAR